MWWCVFFFFLFQAADGIREAQESRGLGDVCKRQVEVGVAAVGGVALAASVLVAAPGVPGVAVLAGMGVVSPAPGVSAPRVPVLRRGV